MSMLSLNDDPAAERPESRPSGPAVGGITLILIALNFIIFLIMVVSGVSFLNPTPTQMLPWGADFGPLTTSGQWWRLLTSCFLHFGIIHIAMNMFILFQIGLFTEMLFGKARYLALYLLAGLGGSIASLYFHPYSVGAGASGAIFGLYGGMLAFLLVRRGIVPHSEAWKIARGAGLFIAYNFVYGITSPNTDLVAHIGGLVTGFVVGCGLAWSRGFVPGFPARRRVGVVAVASVAALAAALTFVPRADSSQSEWYRQEVTGNYVPIAKHGRVIYSGSITRAQAQSAGQAMLTSGFGGSGLVVLLSRNDAGATMSVEFKGDEKAPATTEHLDSKVVDGKIVVSHEKEAAEPLPWNDPKTIAAVRVDGPRIAAAIGGPPLTVRMLNSDGQLRREIKIDSTELEVGNDVIEYSGQATQQQAKDLGSVLQSQRYFTNRGAMVWLAKSPAGTTVGFNMKDGSWDRPGIVSYLQSLGPKIAPAVGGMPIKLQILDSTLAARKEMLVQ